MASRHYFEFGLGRERYALARSPFPHDATQLLAWFHAVYQAPLPNEAELDWELLPSLVACAALEEIPRVHSVYQHDLAQWLTRGLAGLENTAHGQARVLREAREDLQRGWLLLFRRQARPLGTPPPRPMDASPAQPEVERNRFAVCWVDELGQPLAGVPLTFEHAGQVERQATDAAGIGCIKETPAASASVSVADTQRLHELLKARWSAPQASGPWLKAPDAFVISLRGDRLPAVDLPPNKARTVSLQPHVIRTRLIGGFFDSSKTFLLPAGLAAIRAIVESYSAYPRAALLLVGHTDTSGAPDYNDPLSLERAQALGHYLTDDVAGWLKWYGEDVAAEKRWGAAEDSRMISALPDAGSRPQHEPAVRWFQRTRGLTVDGIAGPQTRRPLVEQYMALDGTSLPKGIEVTCHGCGENFPQKATGDGRAELDNRRVEAFFFPADPGILPAPTSTNSKPGSKEYPEWVRKTSQTVDLDPNGDDQTLVVRFPLSRDEAAQTQDSYVLESEDASVRKVKKLSSASPNSRAGVVELTFDGLPEQLAYRLQCMGEQTYTVFDYATLAELKQQLQVSDDDTPDGEELACWMPPQETTDGSEPDPGQDQAVA